MNAIEIEQAVTELFSQPFDGQEFPYAFLQAFDAKETTLKRLRSGVSNSSDLGGVLQKNNIHIAVTAKGDVSKTLAALKASPETARAKAKFVLATDGDMLEAENLLSGESLACNYTDFPDHFYFFLKLAGISTVQEIRDSAFDIRATNQLNKLYLELLRENPALGGAERREDMNHFMARLIFCFFAESTDIFSGNNLFTAKIAQMSAADSSNTHEVIAGLFCAMNTHPDDPTAAKIPRWANSFPYVNGGFFAQNLEVPRFSKVARSYLVQIGNLDWSQINPDIFGSMIQAIVEDEERGNIGMHYTSVPNILKLLDPLFLNDLRARLDEAGDNRRKLSNLRGRLARIRIFDPACGSGNFLVIAYKQLREIEAEINQRLGESERSSTIALTNFRGIELRSFPTQIARLALVIAEYQCDVLYRSRQLALEEFLPLKKQNWITCGNALQLDWSKLCPPVGTKVKHQAQDLFHIPLDQAEMDFALEGGETYICSNPPYLGSTGQSSEQKLDLKTVFEPHVKEYKSLDYVACWLMKAADYGRQVPCAAAFVITNSICQGQQVPILWPLIFKAGFDIEFAHQSFKWSNLASYNAGVTVAIIGISNRPIAQKQLFFLNDRGETEIKQVENINAYLVSGKNIIIKKARYPIGHVSEMNFGNKPVDSGHLLMSSAQLAALDLTPEQRKRFVRRFCGSQEFINGLSRYCLWIEDGHLDEAMKIAAIRQRIEKVREMRLASPKKATQREALTPHCFAEIRQSGNEHVIIVPRVSSENRDYLPVGLAGKGTIIADSAFALYDAPLWNLALIASRMHLVWVATVCGKLRTDFRYSNTLGWNTFPVPLLTEQNQIDLTRCAEDILLARERHFPATIADLYRRGKMPDNLTEAHRRNDEVVERIFIGRLFRHDSERLEKLFDLYGKMAKK